MRDTVRRWMGLGLGAVLLAGGTIAFSLNSFARADQGEDSAQFGGGGQQFGGGGGGFGGGPGGGPGGPGDPGGRGGRFGPGMMGGAGMMGGGGGASMTATSTAVYVLRGNTLYSFDARTLRPIAKADLPMPEGRPGGGPGGRPGGAPGAPGGEGQ
jgi:hypothetical protein